MKKILVMLLTAFSAFAGDSVDIGDFEYQGKMIRNAKATFVATDKVAINGIVIPWDQLNATIQFKLKPLKERVADQLSQQEEDISKGMVSVTGKVIRVVENGCIVRCYDNRPPQSDFLTRIGGGYANATRGYTPAIPEASGTILVRGISGLADGEQVKVNAFMTQEMFQYRGTSGAVKTLRIYNLAP
jgi:hypothetical protein